jgi:hypothetical protein
LGKTIEEYTKSPIRSKKIIRLVLVVFISILTMLLAVRMLSGIQSLVILPVKKVQIYGTEYVENSRILEAVKLNAVRSLLSFNKMRAKASLLKDRRIKGVEIAKLYPDTLKIYVIEKEAVMLLFADRQLYSVSHEGVVLSETNIPEDYIIPLISLNINNDDIIIGSAIDNFMVRDITGSMQILKKQHPDFYDNIRSFTVNDDGVYVSLKDNDHEIYFGSTVTVEKLEKLHALLVVLSDRDKGKGEGIWEIDMSFSHAAVRKRESKYELR